MLELLRFMENTMGRAIAHVAPVYRRGGPQREGAGSAQFS